jgi:hypothetical protein
MTVSSFPAAAAEVEQPSAEAWANCAWREVPVTAQNWLDDHQGKPVTANPSKNPLAKPQAVLELRMNTACPKLLPKPLRSIFSSAKNGMRLALEKARPATPGRDRPDVRAFVCEYHLEGQLAFTVLSSEKAGTADGVKPKCFKAQSDGSLIDA